MSDPIAPSLDEAAGLMLGMQQQQQQQQQQQNVMPYAALQPTDHGAIAAMTAAVQAAQRVGVDPTLALTQSFGVDPSVAMAAIANMFPSNLTQHVSQPTSMADFERAQPMPVPTMQQIQQLPPPTIQHIEGHAMPLISAQPAVPDSMYRVMAPMVPLQQLGAGMSSFDMSQLPGTGPMAPAPSGATEHTCPVCRKVSGRHQAPQLVPASAKDAVRAQAA